MDKVSTDMIQKTGAQIQIVTHKEDEEQKSNQDSDFQCQEIFYLKSRIREFLPDSPSELVPVDLPTILEELQNLSFASDAYENNGYASIQLYNQKNLNSLHVLRLGEDFWQFFTPVFAEDPICRCKHIAQVDTQKLEDMVRAFCEGNDWYGMANFFFDDQGYELEYEMFRDSRYFS